MNKKKFCCEYCYQPIGYVDMDKISTPMTPDMFSSIMPDRGVPDPFHISLEWKDFKCPYCHLRPFLEETSLMLIDDRGNRERIEINKPGFVCERCGKEYAHQSSLIRHRKTCNV